MKNKFFIIALGLLVVFTGIFLYFKSSSVSTATSSPTPSAPTGFSVVPKNESLLVKPHSPVKGAVSAKVTLVEFLDPECEACGALYPMVSKIYDEYKTEMRLVVRYMLYHKNSKYVANILEGARAESEEKYWSALALLFSTQDQWADHHNPKPELIPEILKPLKLNLKKIVADAQAGKYDQQVMGDMDDGKSAGVRGTPTFFVNGNQVEQLSYEALKQAIDSALGRN